MGLIRFLVDSPMMSEEIIFSEDSDPEKLTILVGSNGSGKTAILSLIEAHHSFLDNLAVNFAYADEILKKYQGSWNICYNANIVQDHKWVEQIRYEKKYNLNRNYDDQDYAEIEKIDFSNWIFLKEFHWISGIDIGKEWKVELDYEDSVGTWKIQFKHLFYENEIPRGGSIQSRHEEYYYFNDYDIYDGRYDVDGEEHEFRGEFKGIQTKLKVSFIENHHPIFLDDGSMLDTIPKNHENSLVLHSRVYPYEDQPYGEIIFEGEEKHLSCDAIIMMMNLVSIHPTIPTTRLEGIRKGSNPLQVLQYLNHRKSSLRREQWVGNEILGGTWVPGEYFIKTIKDYYLFITGEECKVLDSPDFLFDQGKKYGKYNLKEDPEVQYMTSGQQHLLLLLIRICTARGGLLLLDEIELGLHEGYLERLSILINRNKKDLPQMLVSTHSPIFAGLNIENTHFIEKNGAGQ